MARRQEQGCGDCLVEISNKSRSKLPWVVDWIFEVVGGRLEITKGLGGRLDICG